MIDNLVTGSFILFVLALAAAVERSSAEEDAAGRLIGTFALFVTAGAFYALTPFLFWL